MSIEPPGCMCKQRVNLAGIGNQIGSHHDLSGIILSDVLEQALEFGKITLDGLAKDRVCEREGDVVDVPRVLRSRRRVGRAALVGEDRDQALPPPGSK